MEIVRWAPRFEPGGRAERQARRIVRSLFLASGGAAAASVVVLSHRATALRLYTPVLGAAVALTLGALGLGMVAWTKLLLAQELAVERRSAEPTDRPAGGA